MRYSIGIYQKKGSVFSDIICNTLELCDIKISRCSGENESSKDYPIPVFTVECPALFPDYLDICILESGYQKSNSFPNANTVIVPDICSISTIKQLAPKSVVTCGLSCKNTVTVSSLIENKLIVSIQREIVSLYGNKISEQEFSIDFKEIDQIEAILAAISVLLLIDIPICEIIKINFSKLITHCTA